MALIRELVCTGSTGDRLFCEFGVRHRASDQFPGRRPIKSHSSLGGVHRFGDTETQRPEMMAKGERGIPVQDGRCTEAIFGKRIGDDVSRSVNRPASKRERPIKGRRFAQGVGFEGSVRLWKLYCSIHL